jgi:peptidoglycan/xylan/chitin deacetylase (PgdA/CDA1 family)
MKGAASGTLLLAASFLSARSDETSPALGPVGMDSYTQTVTVTFRSEVSANAAHLHIAPLYHDLKAAFSTRMDESDLNDLMVAEVLEKFDQKGTFYLNSPESWWQDSPATGKRAPTDPAMRLLAGGNSIGGHALSHDYLPVLSKNSAFREIMGVRVALEAHAASPCISFTYPFVAYLETSLRDASERADLEEMLRRSGFYQLAEDRYNEDWDSGLQDAFFITVDYLSRAEPGGDAPGGLLDAAVENSRAAGAMITVPISGWAARLGPGRSPLWSYSVAKYGPQMAHGAGAYADAGNGLRAPGGSPSRTTILRTPAGPPRWISSADSWST